MKILIYSPQPTDATSFYRAYGVFAYLPGVEMIPFRGEQNTWADLIDIDLAFFQRPYTNTIVQTMEYLKRMGKPVWIDYDDDFLGVPSYLNTRWKANPETHHAIKRMCEVADIITVSTENLKRLYSDRAKVIPNALNDFILTMGKRKPAKKRILWRGSASHQADLYEFREPILRIMDKYQDWQFVWFGMQPIWTDKGIHLPGTDLFYYFDKLIEIDAQIGIVPLITSDFNRSKSNIAELEMSWAGANCLVPDWVEWKSEYRYHSLSSFERVLEMMLIDKNRFDPIELPVLSQVNLMRINIIKEFT
jgi:hypothetical protein